MLVCFTEEESAKELLSVIIPKIAGSQVKFLCVSFEGKQDLNKQLERKLKKWCIPDTTFLILTDQDSNDCKVLKQKLISKVTASGKINNTKIRIACHELESFYLGDLSAVEKAFVGKHIAGKQNNTKFRNPDRLGNPKQELERLTNNEYSEITGSQLIARQLKLDGQNRSKSFNMLVSTIRDLAAHF